MRTLYTAVQPGSHSISPLGGGDISFGDVTTGVLYPYVKDKRVYKCPSDTRRPRPGEADNSDVTYEYSYTINAYIMGYWGSQNGSAANAHKADYGFAGDSPPTLDVFPCPAKTPSFVEELTWADKDVSETQVANWIRCNDARFMTLDFISRRHFGHANIAFLDGHIETITDLAEWCTYMRKDEPDKLYFQYPLKLLPGSDGSRWAETPPWG